MSDKAQDSETIDDVTGRHSIFALLDKTQPSIVKISCIDWDEHTESPVYLDAPKLRSHIAHLISLADQLEGKAE